MSRIFDHAMINKYFIENDIDGDSKILLAGYNLILENSNHLENR